MKTLWSVVLLFLVSSMTAARSYAGFLGSDFQHGMNDYLSESVSDWGNVFSLNANPLAFLYVAVGVLLVATVMLSISFLASSLITRGLKSGKRS